ncbi:MAG: translocation/assembly module TamB, partial [Prevotella sp.]|nr:translocation/assembly module TamB [Prevotella sp.]
YKNVKVNGAYSPKGIHGKASIDDPNIMLNIEGFIEKQGHQNNIQLTANVKNLSPKHINLTDKWDATLFSGMLNAHITGNNVNDAVGNIEVSNFTMTSPTEQYTLNKLSFESNYTEEVHHMTLDSDFGTVEITGDFDYETLPQSFTNFIAARMPNLPSIPKVNPHTKNNFLVSAHIHKADWLEHLFKLPIRLPQPLTLQGMVNDPLHSISIECEVPQLYYKDSQYTNGRINLTSPSDTLRFDISMTKLMADERLLDLHAFGNVAGNNLYTSFAWDNRNENPVNGQVNATISFDTTYDEQQTAYISIEPSQINIHHQQWDIEPSYISYSKNHVEISQLSIHNDQQFLMLNGTASESANDSVCVQMRDIDVAYILELVDFDAVSFDGYASGSGTVRGIFGELEADAQLKVSDFKFEHGRMGTLDAQVNWNKEKEQIDIDATANDGVDAMTYIKGYVSPKRNFIDLGIQAEGTYLDFAQSFTSSFLSSVKGHGNGTVRLAGPLDAINLTGELALNGTVHVKTLGTDYELRNDTIRMVPNEIEFVHCPIYDMNNQQGILTGGIHHKELTHMTYDIYVQAHNLLAYDFKDFGEDTFYGTVYADGNVAIHGRNGSVLIEADVTPQPYSVFVYNVASPDAINSQEFIEWNAPQSTQSTPKAQKADDDFRSDLTMRLKVNATPQASIRLLMDPHTNDYITLQGNGELQTTYYNKGGFQMFGTYRVTDGTYGLTIQNIIKKNFVFREGGTIVFDGDPYDATLNMQAQHTVNSVSLSDLTVGRSFSNTVRVNCLMNITGQPKAPIIDFDLDLPNANADETQMVRSIINGQEEMNQQVIYLLAVG